MRLCLILFFFLTFNINIAIIKLRNIAILLNTKIEEEKIMNDDFFQALASPYRREIIKLLKWQNLTAGEIAAKFEISQPSISRHLDILKRAEIIVAEKRANQIIYSLNLSVLQELMVGITGLLNVKGSDEDAEGNN
ncbi:hypothetical protein PSHO110982_04510 [Pseudostreptobacillus hongkongensis]